MAETKDTLEQMEQVLQLTERSLQEHDPERYARAEAVAAELLELLCRLTGDDAFWQMDVMRRLGGEVLGRHTTNPAELRIGADLLRKGVFNQSLVTAVRRRLEEAERDRPD